MNTRLPFFVLVLTLALLTGCAVSSSNNVTESLSNDFTTTLRYADQAERGPVYDVSLTLPDKWVDTFTVRNRGNAIVFDPIDQFNQQSQLLTIEALSMDQYWKMSGAYPNSHSNIINLGDTYFVYYLAIDEFYSGMSEEEMADFSADVPAIVASFVADAQ